jgi:electron transport complex protein RnfB
VSLRDRILAALPQTQCTRCGFPDCAHYAQAIAEESAEINQCPPGGQVGIERLAVITGRPALALNPANGLEEPRQVAWIDESWCIGCTLCLPACPTDAIFGSHKHMHSVIEPHCTGCGLCLPVCPVDCIEMETISGKLTGWDAWSTHEADHARDRYAAHQLRLSASAPGSTANNGGLISGDEIDQPTLGEVTTSLMVDEEQSRKKSIVQAALARAQAAKALAKKDGS